MGDKLIPYWLCYSQYHSSIWLLNCSNCGGINNVCWAIWRLAKFASRVACSIPNVAIWCAEVPLATNSRKGELHMLANNEGENGRDSTVYVFNCIFFTAVVWILNKVSLKCIPNKKSVIVPGNFWYHIGNMPLRVSHLHMRVCYVV